MKIAEDIIIELFKQNDSVALALAKSATEDGVYQKAVSEGALLCPESSATFTGLKKLIEKDWMDCDEVAMGANISIG